MSIVKAVTKGGDFWKTELEDIARMSAYRNEIIGNYDLSDFVKMSIVAHGYLTNIQTAEHDTARANIYCHTD